MSKEDGKEIRVGDIPKKLRGFSFEIIGKKEDIDEYKDVAFLEIPELLIERDHKGPFLRVVTEKGHYRIRLEKEYRMRRQDGD